MVPWWKRLAYGLVGWMVATCVVGAFVVSIRTMTHSSAGGGISIPGLFRLISGLFEFWLASLITGVALGIFGWLLGVPFVLLVRNAKGWRFWIYLALGSGIGPGIILIMSLRSVEPADYSAVPISAAISSLTTLIYLLLLRRAQLARKSD